MSFVRNAVSVLFTNTVNVPVGLVTGIVLARFLSVDDRGSYAVVLAFAAVAALLVRLGWHHAVIYQLRRMNAAPPEVFTTGVVANLLISGAVVGACLALRGPISARFLEGAPPAAFLLGVALIPLQLFEFFLAAVARGIGRFDLHNWYHFLRTTGVLTALCLALVVGDGALVEALAGVVAAYAVVVVGLAGVVVRNTGASPHVNLRQARQSLRFGFKSYFQDLAASLHERIDLFLLAYFLSDPGQIAIYVVAVGVIRRLRLVPQSIALALFPELAGSEPGRAGAFAARVARHSSLWVVVSVAALAVAAPLLIPLVYGEAYRASVLPFLILLPAMAMLAIDGVLARYFTAVARQEIHVATQAVALALNVGVNLWLIPRYGIYGAAIASLCSYTLEAVLITAAFMRHSGQGLRDTLLVHAADLRAYPRRLRSFLERRGRLRAAGSPRPPES